MIALSGGFNKEFIEMTLFQIFHILIIIRSDLIRTMQAVRSQLRGLRDGSCVIVEWRFTEDRKSSFKIVFYTTECEVLY